MSKKEALDKLTDMIVIQIYLLKEILKVEKEIKELKVLVEEQ